MNWLLRIGRSAWQGLFFAALFCPAIAWTQSASNAQIRISRISITGNEVTKSAIILRELVFAEGDTMSLISLGQKVTRSQSNLRNIALFTSVSIDTLRKSSAEMDIEITVRERWYTWPELTFSVAETNLNTWWQSKDFNRLNYGVAVTRYNFRGRNEKLRLRFQYGWERKIDVSYRLPFIDKKKTVGISFGTSYSRNREINHFSLNHERQFFRSREQHVQEKFTARIEGFKRKNLYTTHSINAQYQQASILDTVAEINPNYFNNGNELEFLSLRYKFKYSKKDYTPYPLEGKHLELEATQYGFGLLDNNLNILIAKGSARQYTKLGKRWSVGNSLTGKYTFFNPTPYYLQRGLGYSDLVRGYELYVIDGQHFGLLKSEMKFQLVAPKKREMRFIPFKQFDDFWYSVYLTAFVDGAYVSGSFDSYDAARNLDQTLLLGTGGGINFVTYYDLVIRIEYSVNRQGEAAPYFSVGKSF